MSDDAELAAAREALECPRVASPGGRSPDLVVSGREERRGSRAGSSLSNGSPTNVLPMGDVAVGLRSPSLARRETAITAAEHAAYGGELPDPECFSDEESEHGASGLRRTTSDYAHGERRTGGARKQVCRVPPCMPQHRAGSIERVL